MKCFLSSRWFPCFTGLLLHAAALANTPSSPESTPAAYLADDPIWEEMQLADLEPTTPHNRRSMCELDAIPDDSATPVATTPTSRTREDLPAQGGIHKPHRSTPPSPSCSLDLSLLQKLRADLLSAQHQYVHQKGKTQPNLKTLKRCLKVVRQANQQLGIWGAQLPQAPVACETELAPAPGPSTPTTAPTTPTDPETSWEDLPPLPVDEATLATVYDLFTPCSPQGSPSI